MPEAALSLATRLPEVRPTTPMAVNTNGQRQRITHACSDEETEKDASEGGFNGLPVKSKRVIINADATTFLAVGSGGG